MCHEHLQIFAVGTVLVSQPATISKEEIIDFARHYDPQPAHLDRTEGKHAARWTRLQRLADSSDLDGALCRNDECRWRDDWRCRRSSALAKTGPTRGCLWVEIEILAARQSATKPELGVIRYRCVTRNQENEIVQRYLATAILPFAAGEGIAAETKAKEWAVRGSNPRPTRCKRAALPLS